MEISPRTNTMAQAREHLPRQDWLYRAMRALSDPKLTTVAPRAGIAPRPIRPSRRAVPRAAPAKHHHPIPEFCLALSGHSVVDIGPKRWVLTPPTLAILEPGTPHAEGFADRNKPYEQLWFIAFSTSSVILHISRYSKNHQWKIFDRASLRTRSAKRILELFDGVRPITPQMLERLRADLLLMVAQLIRNESDRPNGLNPIESDFGTDDRTLWQRHIPVLRRVRELMDEQYARPLRVDQIAALTRLSPNYLSTIFRRWTGSSIHGYLTTRRMEQAMKLCRSSELLVKEIAQAVGYDDPLYFSKVFQRFHGRSPTEAQTQRRG